MQVALTIVLSVFATLVISASIRADGGTVESDPLAAGGEVNTALAINSQADKFQAETLAAFDQWANQQELYSRSQISEMRERLIQAIDSASPTAAAHLREEFLTKLNILADPQWRPIEQWLVQTLAVASESYAKSIWATMPDLVADRPDELRSKLRSLAIRELNLKQVRQGFEQTRQIAIQSARDDERRQLQFNSQVRASMTYSTPNLYSPAAQRGPAPTQRYSEYFSHRYGSPFYYPFGGVCFF